MWLTLATIVSKSSQLRGSSLRMFGRCGQGRGELDRPTMLQLTLVVWCMSVSVEQSSCLCVHLRGSVCDIIWKGGDRDQESLNRSSRTSSG